MNPFSIFSHTFRDIRLLLSNPTSVFVALLLIVQIVASLSFSAVFPILLRWYILPSSVQHRIPLNIVFNTCKDELHGACSFPQAELFYDQGSIFSPFVAYSISVDLRFADVDLNKRLGVFQNAIFLSDGNGKQVAHYKKASYIREPSFMMKTMWVCFFPLYLMGWFHDYNNLEIPIAVKHVENGLSSSQLTYQLQDKFAQLETADLLINAQFGLVRHILYYWPLISYLVLVALCFVACTTSILLYWGHRSISVRREPQEVFRNEGNNVDIQTEPRTKKPVNIDRKIENRCAPDEFIPENKDELPECAELVGIPGWDIVPDAVTDSIIELVGVPKQSPTVRHRIKKNFL